MIILATDTAVSSVVAIDGRRKTKLTYDATCGVLELRYAATDWLQRLEIVHSVDQANIIAFAEGWPKVSVR
jgi:hypothetical protein